MYAPNPRNEAGPACRPDLGHLSVPDSGGVGEDPCVPDLSHICGFRCWLASAGTAPLVRAFEGNKAETATILSVIAALKNGH